MQNVIQFFQLKDESEMLPNFVMNRTASIVFTVLLIEVFRLKEMCTLWQYEESDRLYLMFWIVEDLRKEKCSSILC